MESKIVEYQDGKKVKIDILFSFRVEEYNKDYVAYMLNDDGISPTVAVFISEVDSSNETMVIKEIPEEEYAFVLETYENIKKMIEED